jgi:glycosyltransferase involved in cell wall biosynthesis
MNDLKLLSVVIPAYNKPEYLKRCLDSILLQNYRPIQIIVSDDQSPISLEPVIDEFRKKLDSNIQIEYTKPSYNLRPYHNFHNALSKARGRYAVFMAHDDWFVDNQFFSDCVLQMKSRVNCYVSICNSLLENSGAPMIGNQFSDWVFMEGRKFISKRLYNDIHPSYSGVLIDLAKLYELGYLNYLIPKEESLKMNVEPDEGFLMINLLASCGYVAINSRVVSIRGTPPDSYSRSDFWAKHVNLGVFIVHIQLYRYYRAAGFSESAAMIKKLLYKWPLQKYNVQIASYLGNDWVVKWFMTLGVIKSSKIFNIIKVGGASILRPKSLFKNFLRTVLPRSVINFLKRRF